MAFPLAHPAAVLPFRRHYLKWLNFSALVIGSLVPDLGYLFPKSSRFTHQVLGSIVFGLPVGLLILAAFYAIRTPLVMRMPVRAKQALLPLCRRPIGPVWVAVVSLIVGISTHILWDSVTHPDGWLVGRIPFLFSPVMRFDGRTARVCTVLWYSSSFIGVGWLFMAFEKWKQKTITAVGGNLETGTRTVQDALVLAILVMPISLAHHLIRSPLGAVLTAGLCLSLGVFFLWKMAIATG